MSKKILIKLDPDPWRWSPDCSKHKAEEFNKQLISQLTNEGYIVKMNTEEEQEIVSSNDNIITNTCDRINEIMSSIMDPKQVKDIKEEDE